MSSRSLFLLFLISFACCEGVLGVCGKCQSNHVACVSETKFVPCQAGKITEKLIACPSGTFCSEHANICVTSCEGNPSCINVCNKCSQTLDSKFACRNETSYSLCSENVMNNEIFNCDDGYICDIYNPGMCSDKRLVEPQCIVRTDLPISDFHPTQSDSTTTVITTTTITTTTPAEIIIDQETANKYCRENSEKKFISIDPYCKKYIICYTGDNGERNGLQTSCVYYFDKKTSRCTTEKPAHCL